MSLIKVFLERPRILILTLIFFLLVGYSGFNNIPRQEMPELAERWGVIIQVYPGATPERIETQITEILEINLREIPEIRNLNSNQLFQKEFDYSCQIIKSQMLLNSKDLNVLLY